MDIRNQGQVVKTLLAFIAAAMAPAVLCSGIIFFSTMRQTLSGDFLNTPFENTYSLDGVIMESLVLGFVTFVVAFFHVFILGIPLFFLGLRLRMIRWWTTFLMAFIIGSLPYIGLGVLLFLSDSTSVESFRSSFRESTFFGLFGLSGGIVFWILWRYWILEKPPNNSDETH